MRCRHSFLPWVVGLYGLPVIGSAPQGTGVLYQAAGGSAAGGVQGGPVVGEQALG